MNIIYVVSSMHACPLKDLCIPFPSLSYLKQYDLQFYVCIVNYMIYCYIVSYAVRLVM
jgi:hypothetical protein